jgi:hypothetical protein
VPLVPILRRDLRRRVGLRPPTQPPGTPPLLREASYALCRAVRPPGSPRTVGQPREAAQRDRGIGPAVSQRSCSSWRSASRSHPCRPCVRARIRSGSNPPADHRTRPRPVCPRRPLPRRSAPARAHASTTRVGPPPWRVRRQLITAHSETVAGGADARATAKAGLGRGRDQRSGRLLHASSSSEDFVAALLFDRERRTSCWARFWEFSRLLPPPLACPAFMSPWTQRAPARGCVCLQRHRYCRAGGRRDCS